ncbi:MAG TPA: hypothetical protein VHB46_01570 [Burkholderiales bacterium]|nr:hypothetical protein [Burkholderiales bacterium]
MNRLPIAILVGAMAIGSSALAADQVKPGPQGTSKDCSKLSGKEKDKCVQATPAGAVDMQSGTQKKGKSEIAKSRDSEKEAGQANAPAQANDAVGHPQERAPTGEAQTGARTTGNNAPATKPVPQQSKDTVGHPNQRTPTGEAQTGQAPDQSGTRTQ